MGIDIFSIQVNIMLGWMPENLVDGKSAFGTGNGLLLRGNKPLSESMLIQINVPIWHHHCHNELTLLTHWGRDKMDAISQTTFSCAFSLMKIAVFWLNFHWNMFARVQLTIIQHWLRWWLGADQVTSHYLNQWWFVYWRIYVSLGLNELNQGRVGETYMLQRTGSSLVRAMSWRLFNTKPLPEWMMTFTVHSTNALSFPYLPIFLSRFQGSTMVSFSRH